MNSLVAKPLSLSWVLASASPRRQELLGRLLAAEIEVLVPEVEELHDQGLGGEALTLHNAALKARAASLQRPQSLCLGADTLVLRDGIALGKPGSMAEAETMLLSLSGRWHEVWTSVWVRCAMCGLDRGFSSCSRVRMRPMNAELVRNYHGMVNPMDKAGAYGIQEHGELIVECLDGSFSCVMGLPLEALAQELIGLGLSSCLRQDWDMKNPTSW